MNRKILFVAEFTVFLLLPFFFYEKKKKKKKCPLFSKNMGSLFVIYSFLSGSNSLMVFFFWSVGNWCFLDIPFRLQISNDLFLFDHQKFLLLTYSYFVLIYHRLFLFES